MSVALETLDLADLVTPPVASTKTLLRFLTCGSVDDGKSTLIGQILQATGGIADDQLDALKSDSRKFGTQGNAIDLALLVDGLAAEREQGITIDVAYRFFQTPERKFIVADTPGHEQYTRNMATGASTADLGIVLVDARKGLLAQTRRHSMILRMLGVEHVVLAVNKMDLVNYDAAVFHKIEAEYAAFAETIGLKNIVSIPIVALKGDTIATRSFAMPWYSGPALLEHLNTIDVGQDLARLPFRFSVQWVNRPDLDFRGLAGTVLSGRIAVGDKIRIQPRAKTSRIKRIVTQDGDLAAAVAGQAVTLVLADDLDVSRGDMIVRAGQEAIVSRMVDARLLWMDEAALVAGGSYLMQVASKLTPVLVRDRKSVV